MASLSTCFVYARVFHSPPRYKPPDAYLMPSSSRKGFVLGKYSLPLGRLRASPTEIASIPSARPGKLVETDKIPAAVRDSVIDAVDALGLRVTIGDVAGRAGLKVNEAQRALQALAADADGFLEVSDEGDVLYAFPKDYRSKLTSKSLRMKLEPLIEKTKGAAEYLIRVLFGTALIASIVIVFTAIVAIISSNRSENNDRRRRDRDFMFNFGTPDFIWIVDPGYQRRRYIEAESDGRRMNFIESVFSFVFGDYDPNQGIEDERWKLIGQHISSNGGVVAAEELAPYLDINNSADKGDESYMLPVLLRFEGEPQIDDEGNILYRFPSLQRSASQARRKDYVGRKWTDFVGNVDRFLKEKELQFSKTSGSAKAMVIGLGALNLAGVVILGTMLKEMMIPQAGFLEFVKSIFPLLQIYAGSFFAIPLTRWLFLRKRNNEIRLRNIAREEFAKALETPDVSLRRKLLSARQLAQNSVIGQDRIVYRSDKDFVEQDYEARDWDARFRQ